MEANQNAPALAHKEVVVDAPIEKVWELLSNLKSWDLWNPSVKDLQIDGPLKPGLHFHWTSSLVSVEAQIEEILPPYRLSWTGRGLASNAFYVWKLAETEDGKTLVRAEESFEGALPQFFKRTSGIVLDIKLESWVVHLKDAAEKLNV